MPWGLGDVSHIFVIYFSCAVLSQQQSQFYYRTIFFPSSTDSSVTLLLPWLLTLPDKCVRLQPREVDESCFMRQCVQNITQNVHLLNRNAPDCTKTSHLCFFCIFPAIYLFFVLVANAKPASNCVTFDCMSAAYATTVQNNCHDGQIYFLLLFTYLTPGLLNFWVTCHMLRMSCKV